MNLEWMKLQDIIGSDAHEGYFSFRGNRLLLFHANALSQLKDELIKTLGFDLARGVLMRYGYRCGYSDSQSVKNIFAPESDEEWMLAGPRIHTLEGMVQASNEILDYDRATGHFWMKGKWENSYEAEEFLKVYGKSEESVCWTLVGYASGYCSGFFGQDAVCIETKCIAKGDPYCQYEVRAKDEWKSQDRNWQDLQENAVVKSLQHMVKEERDRVNQWKILNEIVLHLSNGLNFDEVERNFYHQVCQLVSAENVYLVVQEEGKRYGIFGYNLQADLVKTADLKDAKGFLSPLMMGGVCVQSIDQKLPPEFPYSTFLKEFLGVPLTCNGRQLGALLVANKLTTGGFNEYDQNLLALLGSQVAMVMENSRMYQMTDQQLKEKNIELQRVNKSLIKQQRTMQNTLDLHENLTGLVLENVGLQKITNMIGQNIYYPIWIVDKDFKVLSKTQMANKESMNIQEELLKRIHIDQNLQSLYKHKKITYIQTETSSNEQVYFCLTPVIAGKEILGFLIVKLNGQMLSEEKKLILRDASVVIALEILKRKVLVENKRQAIKKLLEVWLFQEELDEEQVKYWAIKLGLNINYPISLLVLDVEEDEIKQMSSLINILDEMIPSNGLFGVEENRIVTLVCQDERGFWIEQLTDSLEANLNTMNSIKWRITVGAKSYSIPETRQNFINACSANQILKHLNKNNLSFKYEKLGVYGMLGIHPERFVWFARKLLGEVMDYDEKHKTQLIATLKLYFQNNQNVQAAARRGFLNDGTLKYRLRRIQEIADLDLTDPEINLQIQLALKFL